MTVIGFSRKFGAATIPVAFDSFGSNTVNSATTLNVTNQTVGAGSNRAILAVVCLSQTGGTSPSCTWDAGGSNQAMTLITSANGGSGRIEIWGLVNPISGNKTLTYSYTGSSGNILIGTASFTNVDQTGGATSFPNPNSATATSATAAVTITEPASGAAVAGTCNGGSVSSTGGAGTEIFKNSALSAIAAAAAYNVGTASAGFTWSNSNLPWLAVGCAVKPA